MWDERILWAVIVAVLSKLFFSLNILTHYVAGGIIVVISLSLMLLKPRRPALETQGLETESAYACTTTRSKSIAASGPSHSGGFFNKARNIVINNSTMTDVQVEDKTSRIMELLASHVIFGAAHDDSARNYPPRCHPGTRVKILQRLTTWFYNINRVKSLLWLSGPAGVGKSAIIQSFAESIEHPVASVFVSRPNKRNDPNRIFTTIAYQLAVHIDAYRNYIVERLTANPYLLNKNIQIQFQVFITEPFVERKIGAGGLPLAILLDGLDELEGADAQRDIIRLISTFTQEHPVAPLAWIITSRPEAHITNTFSETTIQDQFESEFIPVDSTEACQDVERFLRESFDTIRRDFPDTIPTSWPEEAALAKLAAAASGLFIFAETAIRFIRDPDHSNPVPRLQLVLSVIDRSKSVSAREQPFALLDNLYTEILLNIPSGLLPTTKLVLRLALSFRSHKLFGLRPWPRSPTLRGMIMILQLDHHTVYAALKKCLSTLRIPPWNEAHVDELTFLHASFADYLMDSERSGEFYIDIDGVEDDVLLFYLSMWHRYFGENSASSVNSIYEHDNDTQLIAQEDIDNFYKGIFEDMAGSLLFQIVERHKPHQEVSPALREKCLECLNSLRKVNMISLCNSEYLSGNESFWDTRQSLFSFVRVTFEAWKEFPHELGESGFLRQVSLKDIYFNCHGQNMRTVVNISHKQRTRWPPQLSLDTFFQQSPNLRVFICGTVLNGRIALFRGDKYEEKYCIIPYRE